MTKSWAKENWLGLSMAAACLGAAWWVGRTDSYFEMGSDSFSAEEGWKERLMNWGDGSDLHGDDKIVEHLYHIQGGLGTNIGMPASVWFSQLTKKERKEIIAPMENLINTMNDVGAFNAESFGAEDGYECSNCGSHELRYRVYDNPEHNGFFCMNCGQSPCGINDIDDKSCTCDMMEYGKYTFLGEKPRTDFPSYLEPHVQEALKKQEQDKENERIRIVGSKKKLDAIRKGAESFSADEKPICKCGNYCDGDPRFLEQECLDCEKISHQMCGDGRKAYNNCAFCKSFNVRPTNLDEWMKLKGLPPLRDKESFSAESAKDSDMKTTVQSLITWIRNTDASDEAKQLPKGDYLITNTIDTYYNVNNENPDKWVKKEVPFRYDGIRLKEGDIITLKGTSTLYYDRISNWEVCNYQYKNKPYNPSTSKNVIRGVGGGIGPKRIPDRSWEYLGKTPYAYDKWIAQPENRRKVAISEKIYKRVLRDKEIQWKEKKEAESFSADEPESKGCCEFSEGRDMCQECGECWEENADTAVCCQCVFCEDCNDALSDCEGGCGRCHACCDVVTPADAEYCTGFGPVANPEYTCISCEKDWIKEAESFEAPSEVLVVKKDVTPKGSKVTVEECVDIQAIKADAGPNYYRVRFREPAEFDNFRVPAWAARAANTMGRKYYDVAGSKVTMGQLKDGGAWKIQSVLIPNKSSVNVKLALKIANHIQDRLEKEGKWASKECKDNETVLIVR